MSPQQKKILRYLYLSDKGLTVRGAVIFLDITKLSTRVSELRADGWDIPHVMEKNEKNGGQHAVYSLSARDMERIANGDLKG